MTQKSYKLILLCLVLGASGILAACANSDKSHDMHTLTENAVTESFLSGPGQELNRLVQDQTQKDCTESRANPSEALAKEITARETKNITYPPDGKLMGDWKAGAKVFNDGFAYRIGSFIPNKADAVRGGNCYACHQGEVKEVAFGNLGPTLLHYGKLRGQSESIVKYTYEKIYNARAFNACSAMPRLGHNKVLSPMQISDLTAYLLSADSPINK